MNISWNNLLVGETYFTRMSGPTFGVPNDYKKIVIQRILYLPNNEAMIFTILENGHIIAFAVGGKFENTPLGPRHRFWKYVPLFQEPIYTEITAAAA